MSDHNTTFTGTVFVRPTKDGRVEVQVPTGEGNEYVCFATGANGALQLGHAIVACARGLLGESITKEECDRIQSGKVH